MEMLTAIQKRRDRSTEVHAFRACINCVFMKPGFSRLASQLHTLFGPTIRERGRDKEDNPLQLLLAATCEPDDAKECMLVPLTFVGAMRHPEPTPHAQE